MITLFIFTTVVFALVALYQRNRRKEAVEEIFQLRDKLQKEFDHQPLNIMLTALSNDVYSSSLASTFNVNTGSLFTTTFNTAFSASKE